MADLFMEVRSDHERVLALLDEMRGDPATPEPGPEERRALAERLVREESRHEAAEELVLWPTVRRALETGDELAAVALDQELVAKKQLNELSKTSSGTEEFETLFHQVASTIRQHIMFEEVQVLRRLAPALARQDAERLGAVMATSRRAAPTRPHPNVPSDPRVLAATGPLVSTVDRVLDALSGRG